MPTLRDYFPDLHAFLVEIRRRPGLYLQARSVRALRNMLGGISFGEDWHGVAATEGFDATELPAFRSWLDAKPDLERISLDSFSLAERIAGSDEAGLALWFEWYDAFHAERELASPPHVRSSAGEPPTAMPALFHVSEDGGIKRFDPRPAPGAERPVVWAVGEDKLRNYLLPRDCPRVTYFAGPKTSAGDVERFLGTSPAVVAFESTWLDRVLRVQLWLYELPAETFRLVDACAGYYQSEQSVVPMRCFSEGRTVLDALAYRGVEVRIVPSLWPLHDAVIASSLSYSIIRMRNAAARPAAG